MTIDDATGLHYLGNYERELPVSLHRMMENAYDWEHLPYVHPSAFAAIELIDEGEWGWRCRTTLPPALGGGEQELELRVDRGRHFWATTILSGAGEGVQIRTQATGLDDRRIAVDVRFYVPQEPRTAEQGEIVLQYLRTQYAGLYDEDADLMTRRQTALDKRTIPRGEMPSLVDLGDIAKLDKSRTYPVDLAQGAFTVRCHDGEWIAHASICPHMLGPLQNAPIQNGHVMCPWHNYAFAVNDGMEKRARCGALPSPPPIMVRNGRLLVGSSSPGVVLSA